MKKKFNLTKIPSLVLVRLSSDGSKDFQTTLYSGEITIASLVEFIHSHLFSQEDEEQRIDLWLVRHKLLVFLILPRLWGLSCSCSKKFVEEVLMKAWTRLRSYGWWTFLGKSKLGSSILASWCCFVEKSLSLSWLDSSLTYPSRSLVVGSHGIISLESWHRLPSISHLEFTVWRISSASFSQTSRCLPRMVKSNLQGISVTRLTAYLLHWSRRLMTVISHRSPRRRERSSMYFDSTVLFLRLPALLSFEDYRLLPLLYYCLPLMVERRRKNWVGRFSRRIACTYHN